MFYPFLVGVLILLADLATKYLTQQYIPLMEVSSPLYPYGGIGVFQNIMGIEFSITHNTNRGAAWGAFANFQTILLIIRIVLVGGLIVYLGFFNKRKAYAIPLAMIIAGALGNILDYFFYGHVVDMIHFILWGYDFPVFNIADTSIFLGIVSMILLSWKDPEVSQERP